MDVHEKGSKMTETFDQQEHDANLIFNLISPIAQNYQEAERMVTQLYVPDMNVSRSGICRALKQLEKYYRGENECQV